MTKKAKPLVSQPAAQGPQVPMEDLEQFARFLLPRIQEFYQSPEGQAEFERWKAQTVTT